tara:strand:- start:19 stop:1494 length:1476 start_codon:yes stop_codon:yes gene_type:complete
MKSSETSKHPVIVIGAGIAGLASACRLASQGEKVILCEAAHTYGGKVGEIKNKGFRFDQGPSLFTLPELLDELFVDCGKNPRDFYSYYQLPVVTKYIYPDGLQLKAYANLEDFKQELINKLGEKKQDLDRFFKHIEQVYDFVFPIFLENPIREFKKHLKSSWWESFKMLTKIESFKTLDASNQSWFKHSKTVQLFNRFATYNGSNPYRAPATLNVIPHLEHKLGAYYVKGGMRKVVQAMYDLAVDRGVEFRFNSPVSQILIENGAARGVVINNAEVPAKAVFCNMDINKAYPVLLPKERQPKLLLKQEKSTSALVFYWGMNLTETKFDVHNVLFSKDYKDEFDCLSKGAVSDDPTVYVYISSKTDPSDAPKGKENWFVMINVPPNKDQNWPGIIETARKNILDKLNHYFKEDVSAFIEMEEVLDPIKIEQFTSSQQGALYGNSSNSMFAAFLRHPHQNKSLKSLFFVGGSTHPGGGIPLCLLSAKIATHAY